MCDQRAVVAVSVKPWFVAAWFHYLLTNPVIEADGREHVAEWGLNEIPLAPGAHCISVYFRYRGQRSARLAEASKGFMIGGAERRVEITAKLGPRNGARFRISDLMTRE
ncbi:hypothetical protein [Streptantibioticus ferralitis]|uniref:Uncharacterized protein n=1 Tax=Streptantibioticus ferralitis TaxID=236510 RepID=A0ABT5Z1J8_9ACTN|nr:hypothetical protein [Streptantibioticus ferralitis]MDF2257707.1 hypothetical protein [Streptantibioticus ferralitis]